MTHKPRPGINPAHPPRTWEYDEFEMLDRARMYTGYAEGEEGFAAFEMGWFESRHAHGVLLPNEEWMAEPHPADKQTPEDRERIQGILASISSGYAKYWRTWWAIDWATSITEDVTENGGQLVHALMDHQPNDQGSCTKCTPMISPGPHQFLTAKVLLSVTNTFPCPGYLEIRGQEDAWPWCRVCHQLENYERRSECLHVAEAWPPFTKEGLIND